MVCMNRIGPHLCPPCPATCNHPIDSPANLATPITTDPSHHRIPRSLISTVPPVLACSYLLLYLPQSIGRFTRSKTPPGRLYHSHHFHRVAYRSVGLPAHLTQHPADLAARVLAKVQGTLLTHLDCSRCFISFSLPHLPSRRSLQCR
jgi:hypothetical protein